MTTVSTGAAEWIGLAAAPTFAAMAAATGTAMDLCLSGPLPGNAMTTMYLLMSLFHLPPWLRLASRLGGTGRATIKGDRP